MLKQPSYRQLPTAEWTANDRHPLARLNLSPEELSRSHDLTFESHTDGLDDLQAAMLEIGKGKKYLFIRYQHDPETGTVVYRPNVARAERDVRDLIEAMDISPSGIGWSRPRTVHLSGRSRGSSAQDGDGSLADLVSELRDQIIQLIKETERLRKQVARPSARLLGLPLESAVRSMTRRVQRQVASSRQAVSSTRTPRRRTARTRTASHSKGVRSR